MRWAVLLPVLSVLLACSAVGFQPAECSSLSPDSTGWMHDELYRDFLRGTYDSGDCFEFRGEVSQSVDGGYVVDTEGYGKGYPGDVFIRWESDYKFIEGDLVYVAAAVAESLTFETVFGVQRTIPAFYGSDIEDLDQRGRKVAATRQIIEATRQVEYRANYEQRTVESFEYIQSCREVVDKKLTSFLLDRDSNIKLDQFDFFIGRTPNEFYVDSVPHIVAEGYYTETPYYPGDDIKYGKITMKWTGEDCEFVNIEYGTSPTFKPTRDPNAPQPTYTPRPVP